MSDTSQQPLLGSAASLPNIPAPSASPKNATSSTGFTTQGWYLAVAIGVSIALGNTPVGPLCFGVLTVALIYQTGLLLQGK